MCNPLSCLCDFKKNQTIIEIVNKGEDCLEVQEILTNQIITMLKLGDTEVDPEVKLLSSNYDTLKLSELTIPNQDFLIYKFNSGDCIECVKQQFELLKELTKSESVNVICVFSYHIPREFRSINERFRQFKIYGDFENKWPIKEQSYLLLSSNSYRATHFFVPNISQDAITRTYLEIATKP